MNVFQERYTPVAITANGTFPINGSGIGGFVCTASGYISIRNGGGNIVLDTFPVAAGQIYGLPMFTGTTGAAGNAAVIVAGGARGTLLVQ